VITHGGNNTVTETFYFGKPMIVMPLFEDQFDNAQRIHEKGFGIRISPYNCTEEELLDAIDKLVEDKKLAMRMNEIGKRIQGSRSTEKAADLLEKQVSH
jgi:UDP:flavonoid glycosyltransferase YjiC (YdhE family)